MIHDAQLVDRLSELPQELFDDIVYRATRQGLDPLTPSSNGGRWSIRDSCPTLYTSLAKEGALAEIAFHWGQLTPRPSKPLLIHTLHVKASKTIRIIKAELPQLGVNFSDYAAINYPQTQKIGAAVAFLGCDGLLVPSARWNCENLVLFGDNFTQGTLLSSDFSEEIEWEGWGIANGVISPRP